MSKVGYNKDGSLRKKGSGRPPGSCSFTQVSLGELNNMIQDSQQLIPVSRVWLDKKNLKKTLDLCNELNAIDPS